MSYPRTRASSSHHRRIRRDGDISPQAAMEQAARRERHERNRPAQRKERRFIVGYLQGLSDTSRGHL
jgi:hypothetical protein